MFANSSSGTEHRESTLYQDLSAVNTSKSFFILYLPFPCHVLGRLWGLGIRKTHTSHNDFFYIPSHKLTKSRELKSYFMPEKTYIIFKYPAGLIKTTSRREEVEMEPYMIE